MADTSIMYMASQFPAIRILMESNIYLMKIRFFMRAGFPIIMQPIIRILLMAFIRMKVLLTVCPIILRQTEHLQ